MQESESRKNKIEALYPLTKFYIAVVLAVLALLMPGFAWKAGVFVLINVLAACSGIFLIFAKRVRNSVGILFLILLLIQTLFYPRESEILFTFWVFSAKKEGLLFALRLGFTLLCVGGALIWFFAVTTERDFVLALEKKGLSPKAAYVILSTLQMVPVLKKRSQVIMNAQRARGVETEGNFIRRAKVFVPVLVPLVLSSIQGMEERALTLEARGFSMERKATHLYDIYETPGDRKVMLFMHIILLIGIGGRIVLWLI